MVFEMRLSFVGLFIVFVLNGGCGHIFAHRKNNDARKEQVYLSGRIVKIKRPLLEQTSIGLRFGAGLVSAEMALSAFSIMAQRVIVERLSKRFGFAHFIGIDTASYSVLVDNPRFSSEVEAFFVTFKHVPTKKEYDRAKRYLSLHGVEHFWSVRHAPYFSSLKNHRYRLYANRPLSNRGDYRRFIRYYRRVYQKPQRAVIVGSVDKTDIVTAVKKTFGGFKESEDFESVEYQEELGVKPSKNDAIVFRFKQDDTGCVDLLHQWISKESDQSLQSEILYGQAGGIWVLRRDTQGSNKETSDSLLRATHYLSNGLTPKIFEQGRLISRAQDAAHSEHLKAYPLFLANKPQKRCESFHAMQKVARRVLNYENSTLYLSESTHSKRAILQRIEAIKKGYENVHRYHFSVDPSAKVTAINLRFFPPHVAPQTHLVQILESCSIRDNGVYTFSVDANLGYLELSLISHPGHVEYAIADIARCFKMHRQDSKISLNPRISGQWWRVKSAFLHYILEGIPPVSLLPLPRPTDAQLRESLMALLRGKKSIAISGAFDIDRVKATFEYYFGANLKLMEDRFIPQSGSKHIEFSIDKLNDQGYLFCGWFLRDFDESESVYFDFLVEQRRKKLEPFIAKRAKSAYFYLVNEFRGELPANVEQLCETKLDRLKHVDEKSFKAFANRKKEEEQSKLTQQGWIARRLHRKRFSKAIKQSNFNHWLTQRFFSQVPRSVLITGPQVKSKLKKEEEAPPKSTKSQPKKST